MAQLVIEPFDPVPEGDLPALDAEAENLIRLVADNAAETPETEVRTECTDPP